MNIDDGLCILACASSWLVSMCRPNCCCVTLMHTCRTDYIWITHKLSVISPCIMHRVHKLHTEDVEIITQRFSLATGKRFNPQTSTFLKSLALPTIRARYSQQFYVYRTHASCFFLRRSNQTRYTFVASLWSNVRFGRRPILQWSSSRRTTMGRHHPSHARCAAHGTNNHLRFDSTRTWYRQSRVPSVRF